MSKSNSKEEEDRVPWQYEWKRPHLQEVVYYDEEATAAEVEGQCICMTSAQISLQELPEYSHEEESDASSSLVLTVTIVSSPFTTEEEVLKGDLLVLELIRQRSGLAFNKQSEKSEEAAQTEEKEEETSVPSSSSSSSIPKHNRGQDQPHQQQQQVILKKVLRWPGVALKDTAETRELNWRHHLPVWLGGLPRKQQLPESTGVVSACLCRRLLDDDPKTTAALDALDTMTFLSLGMDPELSSSQNNTKIKEQIAITTEGEEEKQGEQTVGQPIPDLLLACLCNDGSVHVYSPFKLLKEHDAINQQADPFAISMSTFLMGDYVFTQLQNSIWPLSQPEATIKLTVPLKKRGPEMDSDQPNGKDSEEQDDPKISVWDKYLWDPTVDPFTAIYRTEQNVPTHCISAFEYIVIAGRGIQMRRRHGKDRIGSKDTSKQGGFVTILSLRHFSEIRTLFLPFSPKHISPFVWGGMQFLFVLGHKDVAVAIRVDFSVHNAIVCGEAPSPVWHDPNEPLIPTVSSEQSLQSAGSKVETSKRAKKSRTFIHRFQILPILMPQNSPDEGDVLQVAVTRLFASSPFTSPPALAVVCPTRNSHKVLVVQRIFESVDYLKPRDAALLFQGYRRSRDRRILAVRTTQESRHVARISLPYQDSETAPLKSTEFDNVWCYLGQGWCVMGILNHMYLICWDGATTSQGAFTKDLGLLQANGDAKEDRHGLVCGVLPVNPYEREEAVIKHSLGTSSDAELLALFPNRSSASDLKSDIGSSEKKEEDDIIAEAMRNILRDGGQYCSHREKSIRLLERCPTWIQLDSTEQNRIRLERQQPAALIRVHSKVCNPLLLSFRQMCAEHGVATPFNQVLSWLSNNRDFFTAASIALDLLRDANTLQHLWRAFDRIDEENERAKLEGLLDGIIPIDDRLPADSDPVSEASSLQKRILTQLADMTVGCLTRGGLCMSSTLEFFLRNDLNYDMSRTALVLAATATQALSSDKETMRSAMGDAYQVPEDDDQRIQDTLWPVRCLLQAAVGRDDLYTALALLNTAVPLELRRKQKDPNPRSMKLCVALVKLVISSARNAIELLLDLVDTQENKRFWDSLDHETRLELALVVDKELCPMLRQWEVRAWVAQYLQRCLSGVGTCNSDSDIYDEAPTEWLQKLCFACLVNARCDTEMLTRTNNGATLSIEQNYAIDGLEAHVEQLQLIRQALIASQGSGGLDYGLLIPALLLLETRKVQWHENSWVSTQGILNAACDLAGRVTSVEPAFAFDGVSLMKQCTIAGNVCAGANLVGGKNGLILECCSILMEESGMTMEEGEKFLQRDEVTNLRSGGSGGSEKVTDEFRLTQGHKHVLWLLHSHVLQVRTYGEFDATPTRGKVDPVFACRICLKTWYCLTKHELPSASAWLASWLRKWLGMEDDKVSTKRLACAALTRVLLWSTDSNGGYVLGETLELESKFLVQLSQASWSIVESVPPTVADELLEQDAADSVLPSLKRASTNDSYITQ